MRDSKAAARTLYASQSNAANNFARGRASMANRPGLFGLRMGRMRKYHSRPNMGKRK